MSRALTLADVIEEVQRQGADPDSVRIHVSGQLLDVAHDEWCADRRDGGLVLVLGYEDEYDDDEDCGCIECPDPAAHTKAATNA